MKPRQRKEKWKVSTRLPTRRKRHSTRLVDLKRASVQRTSASPFFSFAVRKQTDSTERLTSVYVIDVVRLLASRFGIEKHVCLNA